LSDEVPWRERALKLERSLEELQAKYETDHISECNATHDWEFLELRMFYFGEGQNFLP